MRLKINVLANFQDKSLIHLNRSIDLCSCFLLLQDLSAGVLETPFALRSIGQLLYQPQTGFSWQSPRIESSKIKLICASTRIIRGE